MFELTCVRYCDEIRIPDAVRNIDPIELETIRKIISEKCFLFKHDRKKRRTGFSI